MVPDGLQQSVTTQCDRTETCFRCNYDLRGVADDAPCPECGLLAGRSRMPSEELRHSRPAWLLKLSLGIWLMLAALVGTLVWMVVLPGIRFWLFQKAYPDGRNFWGTGRVNPGWEWLLGHIVFLGFELAAGMLLLGALLVTWNEGRPHADRTDRMRRRAIRLTAAVPLMSIALIHLAFRTNTPGFRILSRIGVEDSIYIVTLTLCIPLPALLFYQLRHLAQRVLNAHLAEHCAIVGVGISATLFAWAAFSTVMLFFRDDLQRWISQSQSWLVMMAVLVTAVGLFYFWAIYLMIRFAIAFAKARRQALDAWRRADLANPLSPSPG
jgi:hypothetical protein